MFKRVLLGLGKGLGVPSTYDPAFHYNCFVETVPDGDRQAVYQELRRMGLIFASHFLPDGRLQLGVRKPSAALEAYNAVAKDKLFAAGVTKARFIELMATHPDMEVTFIEKKGPRVLHAEKAKLSQLVIGSEGAFRRGVAYHNRQQYRQAIQCYDAAIRIEPEDVRAWHNKIAALAQDGKHQESIQVADEALDRYSNVGLLWEAKGQTLGEMGKVIEAGQCMSRACELNSDILRRHEARIAPEDKRFQALMADCRKLGKNPETDVDFWFGKFADFVNAGDAEGTQICLHMAAVSGPDHYLMYTEDSMMILPPGHLLLSKGMLPEDAKVERLRDYFQRITARNQANDSRNAGE